MVLWLAAERLAVEHDWEPLSRGRFPGDQPSALVLDVRSPTD
jgi:hypothetical protein